MQKLGITAESLKVISDFKARASAEQVARLEEVISTFEDGTWYRRWWPCPQHPESADVCELHPGMGILLVFHKIYDEDTGRFLADFFHPIGIDERFDDDTCALT